MKKKLPSKGAKRRKNIQGNQLVRDQASTALDREKSDGNGPRRTSMKINIDKIIVDPSHRLSKGIDTLAGSIEQLGMLQDIIVTKISDTDSYRLLAGRNRLEAAAKNGWRQIPALVLDVDDLMAELAGIDENIVRQDLTALERAETLNRRKEIYEKLYPSTDKPQGGRPSKNRENISSFSKDTAKKTDLHQRTIEQDVKIARDLGVEVKKIVKGTPIEDKKVLLYELAKLDRDDQYPVAKLLVNGQAKNLKQAQEIIDIRNQQNASPGSSIQAGVGKRGQSALPPTVQPSSDWNIITGDALVELPQQSGQYHLIFADPPQNQGVDYGEGSRADQLPADKYLYWSQQWLNASVPLLTNDGSLWLICSDRYAHAFDHLLFQAGIHLVNHIVIYETPGVPCKNRFHSNSIHLLQGVKDKGCFVFRPKELDQNVNRSQKEINALTALGCSSNDNVWILPRLKGKDMERIPWFPVQRRLALLQNIIRCSTNEGDQILDLFCGCATAGVVAIELGRNYLGIEKHPDYAERARDRLRAKTPCSSTMPLANEELANSSSNALVVYE